MQKKIETLLALESDLRALKEGRTPFLDVATSALQCARDNLTYHQDALAKAAAKAAAAPGAPASPK